MPYVLIRHKVEVYAKWKIVFDEHGATRKATGCKGGQIFRSADNPSELVILLEWNEMERAREFVASDDLRKTMQRAGVTDQPDVYFLDEVAKPAA